MQIKRIFVQIFVKLYKLQIMEKKKEEKQPCETNDPITTSAAEQEERAKEAINVKYFVQKRANFHQQ